MRTSIALCTYNGARFLAEQLNSIAAQDRPPDEIVICDDRSTDATLDIVAEFSKRVPFPVRCFVNEQNVGVIKNFEKAIIACTGDIIFLSDHDDYWRPEKIRTMAREFENDADVGLVFSDALVTDAELNSLGTTMWKVVGLDQKGLDGIANGDALSRFIRTYTVTGATAAFRASLRDEIVPIPVSFMHDAWIADIAAACSKVVAINSTLIMYRQHGTNVDGATKSLLQRMKAAQRRPRADADAEILRNQELLRKFASLSRSRVSAENVDGIKAKLVHLTARRNMFEHGPAGRLFLALPELVSRRYWTYSNGLGSAMADVFLRERRSSRHRSSSIDRWTGKNQS
jgi:glycosyltransferase involved in cell wall biosynthesis